jgi:hypothetical protein
MNASRQDAAAVETVAPRTAVSVAVAALVGTLARDRRSASGDEAGRGFNSARPVATGLGVAGGGATA